MILLLTLMDICPATYVRHLTIKNSEWNTTTANSLVLLQLETFCTGCAGNFNVQGIRVNRNSVNDRFIL